MIQPGWDTCKFCRFDLKGHRESEAQQGHPPPPPPPPPPPSPSAALPWPALPGYHRGQPPVYPLQHYLQPPTPQKRNGPVLVLTGIIVAVALAGAGLVIRNAVDTGIDHPDEWDPRVVEIAAFVEDHRGLDFKHPVYVDFLTADEYSEAVRGDESALDDEARTQLEQAESTLRALGLATGDLDLFEASNELVDSGTLAFYMPSLKRVTVRGEEIDVNVEVTLAHELTHALQDQYFDIEGTQNDLETSGEDAAYRALFEGDAVRIESEYVESLSQEKQDEYNTQYGQEVGESRAALSEVPAALSAMMQWPYLLGPAFVRLLAADGGNGAVDDAFENPPTTEEQLLNPEAFLGADFATVVDEPELPDGVDEAFDAGDFGAIGWYIVLAERIDPFLALQAADGWGGDAYVTYEQDGKACMRIAYLGDSNDDTATMKTALDQWVAAMPAGAASVEENGGTLTLQSCDPGAESGLVVNDRAVDVIQIPAARSEVATQGVEADADVDRAFEFAGCYVSNLTFDQFVALNAVTTEELPPELEQVLNDAATACAGG